MTNAEQPGIADYALLSDCQGAALVTRDGSIDWACLPRFDSPATFARILDPRAGHWRLAPDDRFDAQRAYVSKSMVLRTEFRTASGAVAVTDALAFMPLQRGHGIGERAPHALLRLVEGLAGEVVLESEVAPRPEYGLTLPRWRGSRDGAVCEGGPSTYVLSCPAEVRTGDGTARSRFTVRAGQRLGLALRAMDAWEPTPSPWSTDQIRAWLYGTIRGWQSWSSLHQSYEGPYSDAVDHSGRVLQALTYAPSGAIVAAPTTSLPEEVGGGRNWDYRYAWVRDVSLTLTALWVAACPDEAAGFFGFFVRAAGQDPHDHEALQIMYGIRGERRIYELELDDLAGYRDSRPVRIGNEAWRQTQLDVYGELLDAAALYAEVIGGFDETTASFLSEMADDAASRWTEPDHGIWEMRGPARHFLYSKLMCWVALDRALRLESQLPSEGRAHRWRRERDRIREAILDQGWSEDQQSFTQSFEGEDLDASALMLPIVGFLPGDDPRMVSTIRAIRSRLTDERGLVYRYCAEDGLQGGEGAFGICSYWLAHALALAGDVDGAREQFEAVTGFANDVGLLSEEIDGRTGELLGNFPQAFTHTGLVNAAYAIHEAEQRRH